MKLLVVLLLATINLLIDAYFIKVCYNALAELYKLPVMTLIHGAAVAILLSVIKSKSPKITFKG